MLAYVKSLFFHFITIAFVSSGERRRLINERFFWRLHTDTPHHANSFTLPTYFHTQSHTCTHTRTHALTHSHTHAQAQCTVTHALPHTHKLRTGHQTKDMKIRTYSFVVDCLWLRWRWWWWWCKVSAKIQSSLSLFCQITSNFPSKISGITLSLSL